MVVGVKVCELTDGFLRFVCGLYVGILTSPLSLQYSLRLLTGSPGNQLPSHPINRPDPQEDRR